MQQETHLHSECIPALFFRLFKGMNQTSPRGLCAEVKASSTEPWGRGGQRPDGLGLQCSLLSPCLINKVNTGWGVWLLWMQLLLIGSKHSRSTVQCLPPRCFCGGLDEQGYNGGVGA